MPLSTFFGVATAHHQHPAPILSSQARPSRRSCCSVSSLKLCSCSRFPLSSPCRMYRFPLKDWGLATPNSSWNFKVCSHPQSSLDVGFASRFRARAGGRDTLLRMGPFRDSALTTQGDFRSRGGSKCSRLVHLSEVRQGSRVANPQIEHSSS